MNVDTDLSSLQLLTAGGGLVAVVAAFLPWVVASVSVGPVEAGGSATGIEGLGVVTLALGVVAVAAVFALDWADQGAVGVALLGLSVLLVAGWKFVDLEGAASAGIGLYLTLLAGLLVLAGGALGGYRTEGDTAGVGI